MIERAIKSGNVCAIVLSFFVCFPALSHLSAKGQTEEQEVTVGVTDLAGWVYLGRILPDGNWAPGSPKNVSATSSSLKPGTILNVTQTSLLHSDSSPLQHARAPVLASISPGQKLQVLSKDTPIALVGGGFAWVRVKQLGSVDATPSAETMIRVLCDGKDPLEDLGFVLSLFSTYTSIPTRQIKKSPGALSDTLMSLYHIPRVSGSLLNIVTGLNLAAVEDGRVAPEQDYVVVPDVTVVSYESITKVDESSPSSQHLLDSLRAAKGNVTVESAGVDSSTASRVFVGGYMLSFQVGTPEKLNTLIDVVASLHNSNIRVANSRAIPRELSQSYSIRFRHPVEHDISAVVLVLLKGHLVQVGTHVASGGETVESIYKEQLETPFGLRDVATSLNHGVPFASELRPGIEVRYPAVKFSMYTWLNTISPVSESVAASWGAGLVLGASSRPIARQEESYLLQIEHVSRRDILTARRALTKLKSSNIVLSFPQEDVEQSSFSTTIPGNSFWTDHILVPIGKTSLGVQGLIGSYANMGDDTSLETQKCGPQDCPEIVLIDRQLFPHPDFSLDIDQNPPLHAPSPIDPDHFQHLELGLVTQDEHGTAMAGIIACQDNDFGFIGINPFVRIRPFDVTQIDTRPDLLAASINQRDLSREWVYVMASDWTMSSASGALTEKTARDAQSRFQDVIATTIRDARPLFIVAAGQEDSGRGRDIPTYLSSKGPMNLGDLPNVIVVTACSRCYDDAVALLPEANYSKSGFVSIAAPGDNIPTTISGGSNIGKYGLMSGTSPATAITGGVAAAMVAKFPSIYNGHPERVKLWLELTSRPFETDDDIKVQGGIIEPKVALKTPTSSYMNPNSSDLLPFSPMHWCLDSFNTIDASGNRGALSTSAIHRMRRAKGTAQWFVYTTGRQDSGAMEKRGPISLSIPAVYKATYVISDATTAYTLNDFSDLLLAPGSNMDDPDGGCN
jgi:Subtilase family